jgi:hypothetical protein
LDTLEKTMKEISAERIAAIDQAINGIAALQNEATDNAFDKIKRERTETILQVVEILEEQQVQIAKMIEEVLVHGRQEIKGTMNYGFKIGASLIGLFFVCLFIYRLLIHFLIKKRAH